MVYDYDEFKTSVGPILNMFLNEYIEPIIPCLRGALKVIFNGLQGVVTISVEARFRLRPHLGEIEGLHLLFVF